MLCSGFLFKLFFFLYIYLIQDPLMLIVFMYSLSFFLHINQYYLLLPEESGLILMQRHISSIAGLSLRIEYRSVI